MTNSPPESPQESAESDSSGRDSTTSSSDLSDGSNGSSRSPPLKRSRLATVDDGIDVTSLSEDEFIKLCLESSPKPKVKYDGSPQDETFAKLVLSFYKVTKGEDYQFSKIRSMIPFPPRQGSSEGGTHLNFFAHPTGVEEEEYLFYGELKHWPINPEVVDCFKFPLGTDDGIDFIVHPPYIVCPDCDAIGRYELDDSDDFDDLDDDK